jgi:polyisoprenyl-phosphate glycosyltransferase
MPHIAHPELSVVVPVLNEAAVLPMFHADLTQVLDSLKLSYEIVYCDDGSTDESVALVQVWAAESRHIRLVALSRNFGKELATTAGIRTAAGSAILTIDADGQHPVELIPDFVARWRDGAKVVVGMRATNNTEGMVKRWGSRLYTVLVHRLTHVPVSAATTDYRLIDRHVQQQFVRLTEHNRINRGLIDWLGFDREYISFHAKAREHGASRYSFAKLAKLAIDSLISVSNTPLYVAACIGLGMLGATTLLGLVMLANAVLQDPLGLDATGSAYLMVVLLFLTSIVLTTQGLIGLYVSHIYSDAQNRPLYIIDNEASRGLTDAER